MLLDFELNRLFKLFWPGRDQQSGLAAVGGLDAESSPCAQPCPTQQQQLKWLADVAQLD